jgi:hypothetical protein
MIFTVKNIVAVYNIVHSCRDDYDGGGEAIEKPPLCFEFVISQLLLLLLLLLYTRAQNWMLRDGGQSI